VLKQVLAAAPRSARRTLVAAAQLRAERADTAHVLLNPAFRYALSAGSVLRTSN
jgi:hypothetical protein